MELCMVHFCKQSLSLSFFPFLDFYNLSFIYGNIPIIFQTLFFRVVPGLQQNQAESAETPHLLSALIHAHFVFHFIIFNIQAKHSLKSSTKQKERGRKFFSNNIF